MKICGLDEVGRGALAGPLVAAAVVLNRQCKKIQLTDSKKISKTKREHVYSELTCAGIEYRVEFISVKQINNKGIGWANKEIFRKLVNNISADKYLVDGNLKIKARGKTGQIKSIIKADTSRRCVMAASIIAKVTRDRLMKTLDQKFPVYGWKTNVGYGTQTHIQALTAFGMASHHRRAFVRSALKKN